MPKSKSVSRTSSQLTGRNQAGQYDQKRLSLLEQILDESSSVVLNNGAQQMFARQALENHTRLLDLIEELRQVEADLNPKLPDRNDESWLKFFQWLDKESETKMSSYLDIATQQNHDKNECGLITKIPLNKNDTIFSIHRRLMISTETASNDMNLYDFIKKDSIASSMQNIVLVLHLLNEYSKGNKSYWAPYINILPNKFLPVLTMTKKELEPLLASSHIFEALKMIRAISRQYSYFFKCLQSTNLPLTKNFTFQFYVWGVSIVCSRQNEIPPVDRNSSQAGLTHALIPVLDMCNHDRLSNQATFEASHTVLVTPKDLAIGDEITINYGSRTSGEFYIHNGFVPKDIHLDVVPYSFALNERDPLSVERAKLLKTFNMPSFGRFRLTPNDYENRHRRDPHLTLFLIVNLMNKDELNMIMSSDNPVGIADEIYEYIQYQQSAKATLLNDEIKDVSAKRTETTNHTSNDCNQADLSRIKESLAERIKNYVSKRAAIGSAYINETLACYASQMDSHAIRLLEHERSIYQSYVIINKSD